MKKTAGVVSRIQQAVLRRALVIAVVSMTLASIAFSQGQDASIIGQVTDDSGAILPGVTVTATSPALQVPNVVSVTNEQGEYRLAPLPIGEYEVTYTLAGFQTIKQQNIRLTVGFVAKLDITLKIGALEESVTVSGAAPTVDVTSTAASTQLTRETLELIPTTRNGLTSVLEQAPGLRGIIDIGGSNFSAVPAFHGWGQEGEYWSTLDGVLVSNFASNNAAGGYSDYSTFEETQAGGIAKGAEVPLRGASLGVIVKSGGNAFHGSGYFGGTSNRLEGTNLDSTLIAQGLTGSVKQTQWDASLDLGGRIVRDKLWFYVAGRSRQLNLDIPGVYESPEAQDQQAIHTQKQEYNTEKISYQVNQGNRLIVFHQHGLKREIATDVTLLLPWASRQTSDVPTDTSKVQWQGVRGNLVATAQFGDNGWWANYYGHSTQQSTRDVSTLLITGDAVTRTDYNIYRYHTTASVTWYKANGFLGNHEVKTGFDFLASCCGIDGKLRSDSIPGIGDYQLVYNNGVPFELNVFNDPTVPISKTRYFAPYVSDNWTIARRLTLNLGVRYEQNPAFIPAQCRVAGPFAPASCINQISFATWKSVAPRVSAAYQLTRNGKTVLKAGYGLYDHMYLLSDIAGANPYQQTTTTYKWHAPIGATVYVPGEVNLDPNGPDFVTQAGTATAVPDPNAPVPREAEYNVGLERELIHNLSVRVTGVYSVYYSVPARVYLNRPASAYSIPITNLVPGLDGKVSDGPGTSLTYYEYPSTYSGSQFELYTQTSPSGQPNQTFKSIEVAASKRLSSGWQFLTSYSATKKNIPYPESTTFLIPNSFINASDETWEWIGRASGAYRFPHGVMASANWENRSGVVGQTTALFTGGNTIPSIVLPTAPFGSANLPAIHDLDLRLEKAFVLPGLKHKVTARLNLYNALNANTATAFVTTQVGTHYEVPSAILPARIFELGALYTF
jgi:hypothetical protein